MTRIAVIDYGIGNLASAQKAFLHLGVDAALTADRDVITAADGVVLPGVGAFGACMAALQASGLQEVALHAASGTRPFLGVCVGMQMLFAASEESPAAHGLGVLPGTIRRLPPTVKLPQIGWNTVDVAAGSTMFAGAGDAPWFYFVHSYAPSGCPDDIVAGWCEHGTRFPCAVERGPVWATQFHPEKSGPAGLALLGNFVQMCETAASPVR
ncbi:MAG TPA: imidazole glycerol phosphate synthase subunit HisH [Acidimicrobiia bacterium]|jgi:glutamine amidotransferase